MWRLRVRVCQAQVNNIEWARQRRQLQTNTHLALDELRRRQHGCVCVVYEMEQSSSF